MVLRLDIHRVLHILRVIGRCTGTWPPDSKAGRRELILRDIAWSIALLNMTWSLVPLILNVCHYNGDFLSLMKGLSELTALSEMQLNLMICRIQRKKLQRVLKKVEDFIESVSEHEELVLQKYIDRYSALSFLVALTVVSAAVTFCCGPLFLSVNLPVEGSYPFSIETPIRQSIIYCQQVIAILHSGFGFTVDFMVAMLFWFSTARLEMLGLELQNVRDESHIKLCIKKHQEILAFVEEIQDAVRYLISKTNITVACAVIFGAFPLVYNQPCAVLVQFISMVMVNCQRLYVTAWPADDLREISKHVALSAYDTKWMGQSSKANILMLIQRCQKPLEIQMAGLFPALSLEYYSQFIKAISSYFTMMRAAIDN